MLAGPVMTEVAVQTRQGKFRDPDWTASGERRAQVPLQALRTLWINTGSLCNIECRNCYIESSPQNDRLVYMTRAEVASFLDEIAREMLPTREIGFTGGEPFMNPDILGMLDDALARGHSVLVLTNAMQPMQRPRMQSGLLALRDEHGARFALALAGRTYSGESEESLRAGYRRLAHERGWPIDATDPASLVLFPEMDVRVDVPEITTSCWGILHKSPSDVMCAASRMVAKRKGARPVVLPCTLLPYDPAFEMGTTLSDAARANGGMFDHGAVKLCHPHCAKFCVLGGGSCSA
jgi:Radical SAM superfamily/4Fe-4S single cluster domain